LINPRRFEQIARLLQRRALLTGLRLMMLTREIVFAPKSSASARFCCGSRVLSYAVMLAARRILLRCVLQGE
jgi:hypothetical protein